jgi:hypothetical protein
MSGETFAPWTHSPRKCKTESRRDEEGIWTFTLYSILEKDPVKSVRAPLVAVRLVESAILSQLRECLCCNASAWLWYPVFPHRPMVYIESLGRIHESHLGHPVRKTTFRPASSLSFWFEKSRLPTFVPPWLVLFISWPTKKVISYPVHSVWPIPSALTVSETFLVVSIIFIQF